MNKKLIVFLVVCIVVLLGTATGISFAWLTSTGSGTIEYTVGDVSYTVTGEVAQNTTIVPGQNLENSFKITNNSNVPTNLRVSISVDVKGWTIGKVGTATSPNTKDHIVVSANTTGWELVTENDVMYFYYGKKDDSGANGVEDLAAGVSPTTFPFNEFKLNGYVVGNADSGKTIKITITFYAKQADYVTWAELGSFDFTTGLAQTQSA
jgi:hypothetical protein